MTQRAKVDRQRDVSQLTLVFVYRLVDALFHEDLNTCNLYTAPIRICCKPLMAKLFVRYLHRTTGTVVFLHCWHRLIGFCDILKSHSTVSLGSHPYCAGSTTDQVRTYQVYIWQCIYLHIFFSYDNEWLLPKERSKGMLQRKFWLKIVTVVLS